MSVQSNGYLILVRAPTTKAVGSINVTKMEEEVSKVCSIELLSKIVRAPTTKAIGSKGVIKLEPTALVVGLQKIDVTQTFKTASLP